MQGHQRIDVSGALVGERWRIGTTLLEVVQPRLPCFKLGLRMGDSTFLKRFAESSRPGAYLRIVAEGELGAGDAIEVRSAGTAPRDQVNPVAVAAMAEVGIDISAQTPKVLTGEAVAVSDVVITMGCGDTCPYYPGTRYLDWTLDDPAGQGIEPVRVIRDQIKARVEALVAELLPTVVDA